MPPSKTVVLAVAIFSAVLRAFVKAHPACIKDVISPIYASKNLRFCTRYAIGVDRSEGGCCTSLDDRHVQAHFQAVVAGSPGMTKACHDLTKRLLCTVCHPFSAHLFPDTDPTHPLLCESFVDAWHAACDTPAMQGSLVLSELGPRVKAETLDNYCFPYPVSRYWDNPDAAELGLTPPTVAFAFRGVGGMPLPAAMRNVFAVPGTNNLWGISMAGQIIKWVNQMTTGSYVTVLDISDRVRYKGSGSEGLLGLAFHPDWALGKRYFWLYYSITTDAVTQARGTRIARFRRDVGATPAQTAATEKVVWEWKQPFTSHKGGELLFHPTERLLYITSGDGGSENDPIHSAQNMKSPLGKVLRIDVLSGLGTAAEITKRAPTDGRNFPGTFPTNMIYAVGFRSPASATFDSHGNLWVGDVGQAMRESLKRVTARSNHGWGTLEGTRCNVDSPDVNQTTCNGMMAHLSYRAPALEYCHFAGAGIDMTGCSPDLTGSAIMLGKRYRGSKFPRLRGSFVFVDYKTSAVNLITFVDAAAAVPTVLRTTCITAVGNAVVSIFEDAAHELYLLTHSYTAPSRIYALGCSSEWCCTWDAIKYPNAPLCDDATGSGNQTPRPAPAPVPPPVPTTAVAHTAKPTVGTWAGGGAAAAYLGCWNDRLDARALPMAVMPVSGSATPVADCVGRCKALGQAAAGLEFTYECWCGGPGSYKSYGNAAGRCTLPCDGAPTVMCGGDLVLSVYSTA